MSELEAHDPKVLAQYEGLIFSTARLYVRYVDEAVDDIQQILRIKVYKALLSYDASKARPRDDGRDPRDAYVFQCVKNQAKDLLKKKPRNESFIEDIAPESRNQRGGLQTTRDWFEDAVGLTSSHDEVYGAIEDDDLVVPNTLTQLERRVVCLLYAGYRQSEVARKLSLAKRDMERSMRAIRAKMEDWRPDIVPPILVLVSDRSAADVVAADRPALAA